jgi:hypothetical protein
MHNERVERECDWPMHIGGITVQPEPAKLTG